MLAVKPDIEAEVVEGAEEAVDRARRWFVTTADNEATLQDSVKGSSRTCHQLTSLKNNQIMKSYFPPILRRSQLPE
jgi:hypothetical protein